MPAPWLTAVWANDAFELAEAFERRLARMLIEQDPHRVALLLRDVDTDDLFGKRAVALRARRFLLAGERESILIRPRRARAARPTSPGSETPTENRGSADA